MAINALRKQHAAHITVAIPVASHAAYKRIKTVADEVVCVSKVEPFGCINEWYVDCPKISDIEVTTLLDQARGCSIPA